MAPLPTEINDRARLSIFTWLCGCAALIFCMVVLGGTVRLTGSGLSMVDWHLLMGAIPPIGENAWTRAFEQYQQFPEYRLVNSDMLLSEFKFIYLMEYAHRLLGRLIGVVFVFPFAFFLFAGRVSTRLFPRLCFLMLLGALQGGMGWYMVKSGLVDDPQVSQYRLTLHFMLAALIYAYMIRVIIGLSPNLRLPQVSGLKYLSLVVLASLLVMMITGGLVAGTKAGFIFNTFPLMANQWVPDQIFDLSPIWINMTENPVAIQFVHRWLAIFVFLVISLCGFLLVRLNASKLATALGIALILMVFLQVILGILTLVMRVPLHLGVAHQGGAFLLLTLVSVVVSAFFQKLHTHNATQ